MIQIKNIPTYLLLLVSLVASVACSNDNDTNVFANKPFALITATDGERTSISAVVDDAERTIHLTFTKQQDLTAVALDIQLNPGYTLTSPAQAKPTLDLTQPQSVAVASGSRQFTYALTASNETPVLAASMTFRGEQIAAQIDSETRTISFPINGLIYASEYPSELLSAQAIAFTLAEGYQLSEEKAGYDLAGKETLTVYKGRNSYEYTLNPVVSYLPVAAHLPAFKFKRGVNLTYWMTEEDRNWLEGVRASYFPLWKELGFDHYRVPVWERCVFNEDGSFHKLAVDKLHELFTWCEQNDMYAVLDMHELANYDEQKMYDLENPEFRNNFIEVWRKLTLEFKNHSCDHLAFELLNEPGDGTQDASAWNQLQKEVLTAIRAEDPERIVFVPAMDYQNYSYIKYAEFAPGDPNVVVSYHYYLPMLLSHYKSLAWKDYQGGIQYPGTVIPTKADADAYPKYASFYTTTYNAERIMGEMANAATDGRNIGHAIHCGEFGCSKQVPESMRLQWFTDMVAALEANNIPWTLWECLGGGFGFVDEDWSSGVTRHRINCKVLKILTGKELSEAEAAAFLEKYGFLTY